MNTPFSVTARAWKEVPLEKGIIIHSLSDLLNERLQLSKYGSGIREFNFTAIIEPQAFFPTKYRYLKARQRVDAEIRIDYEQAMATSIETFKSLVAQNYLQAIDLLAEKNIADFDLLSFRHDLQELLAGEGWMVPV